MKVIGKFQEVERVKGTIIYSFVRFDIMKKMYEHLADKTHNIIDCGKELKRDGEFNAMIINIIILSIEMDEMNDTEKKPGLTQIRVIEYWWDGIGNWKAYPLVI